MNFIFLLLYVKAAALNYILAFSMVGMNGEKWALDAHMQVRYKKQKRNKLLASWVISQTTLYKSISKFITQRGEKTQQPSIFFIGL